MIKNYFFFVCILFCVACNNKKNVKSDPSGFVKVKNMAFEVDGKPYYYLGTNFWYGINLGSKGAGGNRERLIRELDRLADMGVKNLRVVAGSEGPDDEPYRMLPSAQSAPGKYNADVMEGLDFLLAEMQKRDMKAVMCLNNFWPWSGGMGQYLVWAGAADSIPYPPPHPNGDWYKYAQFAAKFYSNDKAMDLFNKHLETVINRKNSISNIDYKNDPTIMAWELANEPRGVDNIPAFSKWVDATAAFIKKLDQNHLVTTGSEGNTSSSAASGTDLAKDHSSKNIDYTTIHIWVQNWNIYNPAKSDSTFQPSVDYALNYMDEHIKVAKQLKKPIVLEEFGISRDLDSHDPKSTTEIRNKYYESIFAAVYERAAKKENEMAGVNFWAWAGEGRPKVIKGMWKVNDDFIGDPPHEPQGWYSIYDTDTSTISVIKKYTEKMDEIGK